MKLRTRGAINRTQSVKYLISIFLYCTASVSAQHSQFFPGGQGQGLTEPSVAAWERLQTEEYLKRILGSISGLGMSFPPCFFGPTGQ